MPHQELHELRRNLDLGLGEQDAFEKRLHNVGTLPLLLLMVLARKQQNHRLGNTLLLILLQCGPHDGEDEYPELVGHVGVIVGNLPQGLDEVRHLATITRVFLGFKAPILGFAQAARLS